MAKEKTQSYGSGGAQSVHWRQGRHPHGSLKSYVAGFLLSIVLTVIPVAVVLYNLLEGTVALFVLMGSAVMQFVVQLIFFMHLREEEKPRYNLMALILGMFMVVVIVAGSIWIMEHNQVVT